MTNYAEDKAFSFIDEITGMNEIEEIFDTLYRYAEYFGFNSFLMVNVPAPGETLAENIISNHWPGDWYQRYSEKNYFDIDAVAQNLHQSVEPFLWSDVRVHQDDTASKIIMHEAREFHLIDGCCVPVYSMDGFLSAITYGADKLDVSNKELAAIYLMSIYAFNSTFKLKRGGGGCQKYQIGLSKRERECMLWASRGKTSWEIGEILNIAKTTVDEYVVSACRKTNSVTRTQAVVECIRRKEIQI